MHSPPQAVADHLNLFNRSFGTDIVFVVLRKRLLLGYCR